MIERIKKWITNKDKSSDALLCAFQSKDQESAEIALELIENCVHRLDLKIQQVNTMGIESIVEVQLKRNDDSFMISLMSMEGIQSALLFHSNDKPRYETL